MTKDHDMHHGTEEGILRTIRTLGNGSVEVILQDSKVVEVKVKFSKARPAKSRDSGVGVVVWS